MRAVLTLIAVGTLALVAGVAVAGLPRSVPDDVVVSEIQPPPSPTTTVVGTTTPARTPAPSPPTSPPPTSLPPAITEPPEPATTPAPTSAPPAPSTTLVPVDALRVVVANATDAPGAASALAADVRELGYTDVVATDAPPRERSVVFHAADRLGEARRLAEQLGFARTDVAPRPSGPVTLDEAEGDIWVILGPDRV